MRGNFSGHFVNLSRFGIIIQANYGNIASVKYIK